MYTLVKTMQRKMKAVICTTYGPADVLQMQEVEKPRPKPNEILVRIMATAVNSGDVRVRALAVEGFMKIIMRLVLGFSKPRKPVLGTVYAGMVENTGSKVSRYKAGDKVFGMTGFKFGTYAEYITIKESDNVSLMPANATFEEAVSIIFGGQTATYFLEKARLPEKKEAKVLIIGATGAVGSAAVQIARYYGAGVTAVCSSEGKPLVESLGVSSIILYDKEDFTKHSGKFDCVFDAVGKTTRKQCRHLINQGGVYMTVGGREYASESQKQLDFLKELFEKSKIKAIIDKAYPFDKVADAHRYVDTGRKKGNVVLKIND
jgi:NADPH:quinone reductase-like Zn-dependent oxidoreductase